ncbi:hypothetical protein F511_12787 [Dorcoceras hygrometricum]|uniref:PB1 domain-containing protein n=1 Tax=Dorcoceras hygrometricum TaxID=472368 RepID=A0A2Z7D7Y5_9LAMI|nr:hypothetical protein F511_12787 [Dorcoceras hygrometricum]
MALHHPVNELESASGASTPRSDCHHDDGSTAQQPTIRFMCSFGGKIVPRPHDNQLRYVGGDTRIVCVHRHTSFSALLSKLSKVSGTINMSIKYQLPNEDLDALITVTSDEDVENMMEEYNRLSHSHKLARLRLFLFPIDVASSINSLLDGSAKRENWFVDTLNAGPAVLDRGRSEVSSVVSEVPDYLFGLDNSDDAMKDVNRMKTRIFLKESTPISDPGSPAPVVSSRFGSTSPPPDAAPSSAAQVISDLSPVRTKPINPVQAVEPTKETQVMQEMVNEEMDPQCSGTPIWHYPSPVVQPVPAVYYVPGGHIPTGVQPVPLPGQFLQPFQVASNQVVYGAGMTQYEMPFRILSENSTQPMYYAARKPGTGPGGG